MGESPQQSAGRDATAIAVVRFASAPVVPLLDFLGDDQIWPILRCADPEILILYNDE
ncbi:MAG: hypothetical protein WAN44_16605 [Propionibacteriaceae bacterium]